MPMSGEMRLRHLTLALIALTGVWIAVLIQRAPEGRPTHAALAAEAQPPDFPAPAKPKLVHVKGLSRPVAATPIVKVRPRAHVATPAPQPPKPDVRVKPKKTPETESSDL